jgi:hypothetical protein
MGGIMNNTKKIRTFETGATRDSDDGKLDFDGFLSPSVIKRYALYMHQHRVQTDGTLRSSDNWKLGIPIKQYMKSMWRHFFEVWNLHSEGNIKTEVAEEALCALLFNVNGMLHEVLKDETSRYIKPMSKETIDKCKSNVKKMQNKK